MAKSGKVGEVRISVMGRKFYALLKLPKQIIGVGVRSRRVEGGEVGDDAGHGFGWFQQK
jgi:hypothetical protein